MVDLLTEIMVSLVAWLWGAVWGAGRLAPYCEKLKQIIYTQGKTIALYKNIIKSNLAVLKAAREAIIELRKRET